MSNDARMHVFDSADLLPQNWRSTPGEVQHIFNPAIERVGNQFVMCYRVVTSDGRRRLALCRLTPDFKVIPNSWVPFSDHLDGGGDWHADGRFCSCKGRLFLHYNDGGRRGRLQNQIFLVEVHPERLIPVGRPRELILLGPRQAVEKNWMVFFHREACWAVYSISPHVVLSLELDGDGPILCRPAHESHWDVTSYTSRFGQMRGGTPPVLVGEHYVSFFHSRFVAHPLRHQLYRLLGRPAENTVHYVAGAYSFRAEPPFAPIGFSPEPLLRPPRLPRLLPQLNPEVEYSTYPCGAILQAGVWTISHGARNEYCCLTHLRLPDLALQGSANRLPPQS